MKAVFLLFVGSVFAHVPACRAQIYSFSDMPVPPTGNVFTIYAFYVYSMAEAPKTTAGQPFIKFSNLKAKPTNLSVAAPQNYKSLQLGIVQYYDFWKVIDLCSSQEDVAEGLSEEPGTLLVKKSPHQTFGDVNVYMRTVPFTVPAWDVEEIIKESGAYLLFVSNCGTFDAATMSGTVIVKNPYGFLPGSEYYNLPFYGWLHLVHILLGIAWLSLTLRWWGEILYIRGLVGWIAVGIILGLVECLIWYIFYHNWNLFGKRGDVVFVLATLFTVTKSCFSYMLVLVASLGWGVTRPRLDESVVMKIKALSVVYIILGVITECVLSFRHGNFGVAFVTLCIVPKSIVSCIIFCWVCRALSNLIRHLHERRQIEKLLLFQRLWHLLSTRFVIVILCTMFQVLSSSEEVNGRWKYQWVFSDGVPQVLDLFVLVAMMYLWAPHKGSRRYAYCAQEDADGKLIWADDYGIEIGHNSGHRENNTLRQVQDDKEDEEDSFWEACN